jgi:hypothetical protein
MKSLFVGHLSGSAYMVIVMAQLFVKNFFLKARLKLIGFEFSVCLASSFDCFASTVVQQLLMYG